MSAVGTGRCKGDIPDHTACEHLVNSTFSNSFDHSLCVEEIKVKIAVNFVLALLITVCLK
jgi:hypothetical protein